MKEVTHIKFEGDNVPYLFLLDDSLSLPDETFFIHNKNKCDRLIYLYKLPDNITEIVIYNNHLNSNHFSILNNDEKIFISKSDRKFYEIGVIRKIDNKWYFKETNLVLDKNIYDVISKYYKGIFIIK